MTIQASGAISLSQLRTEFGGSAPDSLSEYYRGGALVPSIPNNAAVPTSGAIKLRDFYSSTKALSTVMTRGSSGASRGFSQGSYGSLADPVFFLGVACTSISTFPSSPFTLTVTFPATRSQNFFSSLVCSLGTFNSASATVFIADLLGSSTWYFVGVASEFAGSGTETIYMLP